MPRRVLVASGIHVGVLRHPRLSIGEAPREHALGCVDTDAIHAHAKKLGQTLCHGLEVGRVAPCLVAPLLPVDEERGLADVALAALIEVLGLRLGITSVDVVVHADELAKTDRLLDLAVAVGRHVARALGSLADNEVERDSREVDAVLPIADVYSVHSIQRSLSL